MNIGLLIGLLKEKQRALADDAMVYPQADQFNHGLQVGRHQGVQLALDLIDSILRDDLEKESHL